MRPLLLDLFCGAGGAAVGYHRAGFDVIGVDIEPQPLYPFEFRRANALTVSVDGFDAVHASPPCHDHTTVSGQNRKAKGPEGTGWMLQATASLLDFSGLPWVIENVEAARMPSAAYKTRLCGSSFGLDVRRHRWFISNFQVDEPSCRHHTQTPRFRSLDSRQKTLSCVVGVHGHLNYSGELELRQKAMGIDWMPNPELTQAIPPAYTEYIGYWLMKALRFEVSPR